MIRLKELRESVKMSQRAMAAELQVSKSTYNYWEQGKIEIDFENLKNIADYFNVSVDYLLGRDTPENANKKIDETISRIDRKFNKLNKEQQAQIENYLDFLLSQKK